MESGSSATLAIGIPSRIDSLQQFVERTLGWNAPFDLQEFLGRLYSRTNPLARHRLRVFAILGDPGAGKSSLAVQVARWLAMLGQKDASRPIPVYVNLENFREDYPKSSEGVSLLIRHAIEQSCPRYIKADGETGGEINMSLDHVAQKVISRQSPWPVFFVFDSMDEIPTSGQEYAARVNAVADFINDRPECDTAIVTCRYGDYIKLADYSHDLRIQRLDLLPWTGRLVREYLASVPALTPGGQKEISQIVRAAQGHGKREQAGEYFEPLIVALLSRVKGNHASTSLPDLWDAFVSEKLNAADGGGTLSVDSLLESLSRLAYGQIWPDKSSAEPEVEDIACRAGILRGTAAGTRFEIRPLASHFAAKELVRRVQSHGKLPKGVSIEDVNRRDVFRCVSMQAGNDSKWAHVIAQVLGTKEADRRAHGDRLEFVANCISAQQLEASDELRAVAARIVEFLVQHGDHFDKERCLLALEHQPALIDPKSPNVAAFFAWTASKGSASALRWLLTVLRSSPDLWKRFRALWWSALLRAWDKGEFGLYVQREFTAWITRGFGPRVGTFASGLAVFARHVCIFVGLYLAYSVGRSIALILASPIVGAFNPELQAKLQQPPIDFSFLASRLWMLFVCAYLPWTYMRQQSLLGLGFQKSWMRILALIAIAAGVRFGFLLLHIVLLNIRFLWWIVAAITIAALIYNLGELLLKIIRQPERWRSEIRRFIWGFFMFRNDDHEPPRLPTRAVDTGPAADPTSTGNGKRRQPQGIPPLPSDIVLAQLAMLDMSVRVPRRLKAAHYLFAAAGAIILLLLLTALTLGWTFAVGLALAFIVAGGVYVCVIEPVLHATWMRRQIRATVRRGLKENLAAAFVSVLKEIEDNSHPRWVRFMYVDALQEIRYDSQFFKILDDFSSNLSDSAVKEKLAAVLINASREARKG